MMEIPLASIRGDQQLLPEYPLSLVAVEFRVVPLAGLSRTGEFSITTIETSQQLTGNSWDDLAERPPAGKTLALITDVGNDLIYGEPHDILVDGVAWCLARLQERNAEIVCVRPPLDRLERLSPYAYHAFKRLFFPGPTRPWEEMKALAIQLDASLQSLAGESSARLITPDESWYGADPIHIRRNRRREAWQRILSEWSWETEFRVSAVSSTDAYRWWTLRPAERRAFRRTQTEVQPVLSDPQGVSVWLY